MAARLGGLEVRIVAGRWWVVVPGAEDVRDVMARFLR